MAATRLLLAADAVDWLRRQGARGLATDSRRVAPGDAFIAWPGHASDGRRHVAAALEAGAVACLVEAEGVEAYGFDDARIAAVAGLKAATGAIADRFYGEPSRALELVATTGTNGKTSTAWWMAQALSRLGRRCGLVGTLGIGEPPPAAGSREDSTHEPIRATGLTTPDPVTLHAAFRRFADAGFAACAIEASSIGIVEHRLDAARIGVALFTNFTRDHLDFHGTMAAYWEAKRALFRWPGLRAAVLNLDDEKGAELASELAASPLRLIGYSLHQPAFLRGGALRYEDGGLAFTVHEGEERAELRTRLIGDYNASNLLAVIGGLRALGVPLADAAAVCGELSPVPGRMQQVGSGEAGPVAVVDYAHTPDALEKALLALRPLAQQRGGRLWCVFGCGGNRDASKRPMMGALAARFADRVVLTSDNPRHEAPGFILSQILAGVIGHDEVDVMEDRREAIRHALASSDARDVVLIAGKGHEDYQEIAGVKLPFSDVLEAEAALRQREPRA
ncbi:UDP-N-acetylmuramoyl-L-alanyl-D-glutamate--2,6-diaminopimelate ligase [Caldimonas tepidiphila]|uniref:UDP-N-acetylmuramoyl-L-alanyl-D-glutamate--2, 6-diaminopimelate ligase n=1 Tax=Caldimonas tepidiphila TaxID=2315841 RepID=UPI000E5BB716|nr:UDP-N-acetylmuramoyl-L-alanyl-D-glutamate--2,6-diaminopimelate ligase [Caldimonas tepidiphila]